MSLLPTTAKIWCSWISRASRSTLPCLDDLHLVFGTNLRARPILRLVGKVTRNLPEVCNDVWICLLGLGLELEVGTSRSLGSGLRFILDFVQDHVDPAAIPNFILELAHPNLSLRPRFLTPFTTYHSGQVRVTFPTRRSNDTPGPTEISREYK